MSDPRVRLQLYSRRRVLLGGGATILGANLLPGCDRLVIPDDGPLVDQITPITPNELFYVTSCCGTPNLDPSAWTLTFRDRGAALDTIDLAFLEDLPARDKEHTLQCISTNLWNQAISNAVWSGLPLAEIFAELGLTARGDALELKFTAADGYATSVPRADFEQIWLVWRMNGVPIPPAHGHPARLLVPGRYGTKNPKWITDLDFVDEAFVGFWEGGGWSNTAIYRPNALISRPLDQDVVEGEVLIVGTAFAGSDEVARVEISLDGGETWQDAEITYQNGPDVWTLWRHRWTPAEPGDYTLKVRVTTASGAASSPEPYGTNQLNGYDGSMEIEVTVL